MSDMTVKELKEILDNYEDTDKVSLGVAYKGNIYMGYLDGSGTNHAGDIFLECNKETRKYG